MRTTLPILLIFAACTPGEVRWPTGEDSLRTALFVRSDEGIGRVRLLLSTGVFACDLPAADDPATQAEALLELSVGACREDARHLAITAYHQVGIPVDGRYLGQRDALPSDVTSEAPRLTRADYIGVEEAVLTTSDLPQFGDALGGTYRPTELTQEYGMGTGAQLRLNERGEWMTGSFDFPEAHVSGRFRAAECPAGSTLFELAFSSPTANCP